MSWLLVVQPDPHQADALREALGAELSEDVVVTRSLDDTLSAIDQSVPDVVLVPTLIPPAIEDYLVTYLRAIPGAGHVQILGIPQLERAEPCPPPPLPARSRFPWRRPGPPVILTPPCDPDTFIQDVVTYRAGARALKEKIELASAQAASSGKAERRSAPRFAYYEVPWISLVRFEGERAALMNVSSRGALLRIHTRPQYRFLRRSDPDGRERPRLTLGLRSDREVHVTGRVIRCVPLNTRQRTQYEIAFSFDDPVALDLPAALEVISHKS